MQFHSDANNHTPSGSITHPKSTVCVPSCCIPDSFTHSSISGKISGSLLILQCQSPASQEILNDNLFLLSRSGISFTAVPALHSAGWDSPTSFFQNFSRSFGWNPGHIKICFSWSTLSFQSSDCTVHKCRPVIQTKSSKDWPSSDAPALASSS